MNDFEGRVALVTGAASGIGQATAEALARRGASVAVLDIAEDRARAVAEGIHKAGGRALAMQMDAADPAASASAVEQAASRLGRVDVLVNAAGIIARGNVDVTSWEEWQRVIQVDLNAMFYITRAALPHLRRQGGAVVNIASVAGSRGAVNVAYVAAKGGVVALTRQLANELADDGIRVNSISPGFTATRLNEDLRGSGAEAAWANRIPLKRYARADEIASACVFLASDAASYITGIDLVVDGGLSAVLRPDLPQPSQATAHRSL